MTASGSGRRALFALATVVAIGTGFASPATAANRIYWGNYGSVTPTMSYANLDGSGQGGVLNTAGATVDEPFGVAIDPAGGRIYWANDSGNAISYANLDGSGGGDLNTSGATPLHNPEGVAVDPGAGKIYWLNNGAPSTISYARLDGSGGGGDVNTSSTTVSGAEGIALDAAAGRIYWINGGTPKGVFFANLDGSGTGSIPFGSATISGPVGAALDPIGGRIFWSNNALSSISFANLDGSGGGDLDTTGTTVNHPEGLAVDPLGGKVYWADGGNRISFASLSGGGGGELSTAGATMDGPAFPALLYTPTPAGAPVISGASAPGAVLSCSSGQWGTDLLGSFVYRAPRTFTYQWNLNGTDIADATSSSYTASSTGDYRCTVTASNEAGPASQTSDAHAVAVATPAPAVAPEVQRPAAFGAQTLVTLALAARRIPAKGPVKVRVSNGNGFPVTGTLGGASVRKLSTARLRRVRLASKSFRVAANSRTTVALRLSKPLVAALRQAGKLQLRLTAVVVDPARNNRKLAKTVTVVLKRAKR